MSLISIVIGNGGLGVHSSLTQYAADYVELLKTKADDLHEIDSHIFRSALEKMYFIEKPNANDVELNPRSMVLALDNESTTSSHLNSCRRLQSFKECSDAQHSNGTKLSDKGNKVLTKPWSYLEKYILNIPESSSKIWSRGHFNAKSEGSNIRDVIRHLVEDVDSLSGFMSFASLGGGSGSGMGSYISTMLSDHYPKQLHLTTAIAPFHHGENAMQSLNMTLALSHHQEFSDGIIILQNDQMAEMSAQLFDAGSTSFDAFNEASALNILHALRPPSRTCPISGIERCNKPLHYMADGLCSNPSLKLLSLHLMPLQRFDLPKHNSTTIHQMLNHMADTLQALPMLYGGLEIEKHSSPTKETNIQESTASQKNKKNNSLREPITIQDFSNFEKTEITKNESRNRFKPIAGVPILSPQSRDLEITDFGISSYNGDDKVITTPTTFKLIKTNGNRRTNLTKYNVVAGIQVNIGGPINESVNVANIYQDVLFSKQTTRPIQVSYSPHDVGLFGNIVSQISNSQAILPLLDFNITTAKMLYATNAYMHNYNDYGFESVEMQDAIAKVQEIITSYAMLSKASN
ncbi:Tubulin/FtsZ family GTPase domain protein [Babesia bovis T2Bo]|uniref:Tubulin delta chain n=1 Tax=Babesia bovis TaxID=5865 RepID=A7ANC7_BABBO|nr:Tubulin/FtsZ family GTPase domain protein [Babesia bovis T2Bo]EDO08061.1 Tubulin/FtsZ family GTPase domain protein [Babesia bovis T2Bo]|eukprot:XP_001611629.1 hypothetical protein [Babesia bovis T2Bo]